jgi:hypothetical protein
MHAKPLNQLHAQLLEANCKIFDKSTTNKQALKLKVPGNSAWEHYKRCDIMEKVLSNLDASSSTLAGASLFPALSANCY